MSEAAAAILRARARHLRTDAGRIASEWHKADADMVAGELERMAKEVARLSPAPRRGLH